MDRRLRMGMIGGGTGAFIGAVHRMAVRTDGQIELVCGAFSSDPDKSLVTGRELYLPQERIYGSYQEMIMTEALLPEDVRMDFVSIVTPNHLHFVPCRLALEKGFHVMCEKPLSLTSAEAEELVQLAEAKGLILGLMHNYTGYPMVKEARELVREGKIGKVLKVIAEYQQGWLSQRIEQGGQKQASWRTDPVQAGISCCVADIGTHAENLAEYMTGLRITELCADISTFVEGRKLEDDANILVRFDNGAKGAILVSQIASGEENELRIRIYGEKGNLEWLQTDPNNLHLRLAGHPKQILRPGNDYLHSAAKNNIRLPSGHPEGYIESLANVYRQFYSVLAARLSGEAVSAEGDFPTVKDGLRGMKFIEAVIQSGSSNATWVSFNN